MSIVKENKLNYLLRHIPEGDVITSRWLKKHGYYSQLVAGYRKKGWLRNIGQGAFLPLNQPLTWQGAVKALQDQLDLKIHLGGLSALEINGISQYARFASDNPVFYLYLSCNKNEILPKWFKTNFCHSHYALCHLFANTNKFGLMKKRVGNVTLIVSPPERAILEMLYLAPYEMTLLHVSELIEGMHRLRPKVMQYLLEACQSIKVKRLFLFFAERHQLPCFSEIDLKKIALGKGKRVIGGGGKYYPQWKLSLPFYEEYSETWEEGDA